MARMLPRTSALVIILNVILLGTSLEAAGRPASQTVDGSLKAALAAGVVRQRVIITAIPGCRDAVRQTLQRHSTAIKSEYAIIEGFSGEILSADVADYANNGCVRAIAADSLVHSTANSSQTGLTSALRDTLGLPHFANLDPNAPTGATGVSVAIIDSGITP